MKESTVTVIPKASSYLYHAMSPDERATFPVYDIVWHENVLDVVGRRVLFSRFRSCCVQLHVAPIGMLEGDYPPTKPLASCWAAVRLESAASGAES